MSEIVVHEPVRWKCVWSVDKYEGSYAYRPVTAAAEKLAKWGFVDHMLAADLRYNDMFRNRWADTFGYELYYPGKLTERIESEGNALMFGGASNLWQCLIGNGGTANLNYFNTTNGHIGVGTDAATPATGTQNDLIGASKLRKVMDSGFPTHTDGVVSGASSITFKATFAPTDANFAWNEWGVFNASTGGRMLNRKVESLGTKTGSATWAFTVTLSLS